MRDKYVEQFVSVKKCLKYNSITYINISHQIVPVRRVSQRGKVCKSLVWHNISMFIDCYKNALWKMLPFPIASLRFFPYKRLVQETSMFAIYL